MLSGSSHKTPLPQVGRLQILLPEAPELTVLVDGFVGTIMAMVLWLWKLLDVWSFILSVAIGTNNMFNSCPKMNPDTTAQCFVYSHQSLLLC